MSQKNHIVVIADPASGKDTALKRALALQARTSAKITFLGFTHAEVDDPQFLKQAGMTSDQMRTTIMESRRQQLAEVVERFQPESNAEIAIELIWSKEVAPEIVKFSKEHKPELVIKSGHRSETWRYTSTDWQLFRECPSPVMITAGKTWKKKSRILIAIDFLATTRVKRELNDKIVQQAKSLASTLDEEIHIACALTVPQPLVDLDVVDPRKFVAEKRKALQPTIETFCESHGLNPSNVHLRQGTPGRVIPSIANSLKVDLVIAGTVGRKNIKGKLLGNTAEAILHKLRADILAVKP